MASHPQLNSTTPPQKRSCDIKDHQFYQKLWIRNALEKRLSRSSKYFQAKSRKPFYKAEKQTFNLGESWKAEWEKNKPRGGDLIPDPTERAPGFSTCRRNHWVAANRLRTRHARTAANKHRWGLIESPECPKCNNPRQTTDHILLECPITKLEGGYNTAHKCEEDFTSWIDSHKLEM